MPLVALSIQRTYFPEKKGFPSFQHNTGLKPCYLHNLNSCMARGNSCIEAPLISSQYMIYIYIYIMDNLSCFVGVLLTKKMITNNDRINSLWPGDAIWWQGTRSTLTQVMACCLTAPNHYLNQCWLIIGEVPWHSSQGIIIRRCEDANQ